MNTLPIEDGHNTAPADNCIIAEVPNFENDEDLTFLTDYPTHWLPKMD